MIGQLESVVMQQITVTKGSWNLSSIRSCSMLRFHTITELNMAEEARGNYCIALLEIVLLLLSQTSIIAVDYDLEGVLELEELDNVMEMDGKCVNIRGLF